MASIRHLDQATISSLRSSFVIQTLPACLVELVQNALDARARSIDVAFSLASWQCRVTDDGLGIPKDSLKRIAQRYCAMQLMRTAFVRELSR